MRAWLVFVVLVLAGCDKSKCAEGGCTGDSGGGCGIDAEGNVMPCG